MWLSYPIFTFRSYLNPLHFATLGDRNSVMGYLNCLQSPAADCPGKRRMTMDTTTLKQDFRKLTLCVFALSLLIALAFGSVITTYPQARKQTAAEQMLTGVRSQLPDGVQIGYFDEQSATWVGLTEQPPMVPDIQQIVPQQGRLGVISFNGCTYGVDDIIVLRFRALQDRRAKTWGKIQFFDSTGGLLANFPPFL